jgi:hypothetical protein
MLKRRGLHGRDLARTPFVLWLRQPSTVCFTVCFHALSQVVPQQQSPIILCTQSHTTLFCHPKDRHNPVSLHHVKKAAQLHILLSTIPRKNAVWAALRAVWAALTSYPPDLRYPLFWQGLESAHAFFVGCDIMGRGGRGRVLVLSSALPHLPDRARRDPGQFGE